MSHWPFDGCQFCGSLTHAMTDDTPGPLCSCVGMLDRAIWRSAVDAATHPRNEPALRAIHALAEMGEPCREPVPCSVIWTEDEICDPCQRARLAFYELAGMSWVPIAARLWPQDGGYWYIRPMQPMR